MISKGFLAIILGLMLFANGGTSTLASELTTKTEFNVETDDKGIVTIMEGDKEFGVFIPDTIFKEILPSYVQPKGTWVYRVNQTVKPGFSNRFQASVASMNKNDSIRFNISWFGGALTTVGLYIPVQDIQLFTSISGVSGTYFSKSETTQTVTPYIYNQSNSNASYTGTIEYNLY